MRIAKLMIALMAAGAFAGCSGSTPTSPSGMPGTGGNGGGSNDGGGNSGGGGGPVATSAAVTVGNIFFRSGQNSSANPAQVTIAAGGAVTWTWADNGNVPHNVQSVGSPGFTSSAIQTAAGSTYQVTFSTAGVYHYNCIVHGSAMSGTVVVQ
jgi:plastocyanin